MTEPLPIREPYLDDGDACDFADSGRGAASVPGSKQGAGASEGASPPAPDARVASTPDSRGAR